MIDHIILTVSDLHKSAEFYTKALTPIGYSISSEFTLASTQAKGFGFGAGEGRDFFITEGRKVAPPIHVAFRVSKREQVDAFYQTAIAAGGRDNGKPDLTPEYDPNYYSAYVFDPDGHNIEAVCFEPL
jgi:catechol 2,3-dioxygenase-like lactoylglutathione lyase family enzyme